MYFQLQMQTPYDGVTEPSVGVSEAAMKHSEKSEMLLKLEYSCCLAFTFTSKMERNFILLPANTGIIYHKTKVNYGDSLTSARTQLPL